MEFPNASIVLLGTPDMIHRETIAHQTRRAVRTAEVLRRGRRARASVEEVPA